MKEIYSARSTNGRWGVSVVSPDPELDGTGGVFQGYKFVPLGTKSGVTTFALAPSEDDSYAVINVDSKPRVGAIVVHHEDLQSNSSVTLLHVREGGVIEEYGYKRRSSRLVAFRGGEPVPLSPAVALALGLVAPDKAPAEPELPPPPPLPSAFADALAAALARDRNP
jgi:hypothetical protein